MDTSHLSPTGGGEVNFRQHHEQAPDLSHAAGREFHSVGGAPSVVDMHPAPEQRRRKPRKLILCFDGTGNKFRGDDSDSNILKIFRMLDRTADDQYHYYQPGIGTYVVSQSLSHTSPRARLKSWYMKAKDSAVGSSFDQHVVGGYRFLMRFYSPGDAIYIFGFSRGAYIARFLAEMLDYVGLLSHGNEEMVHFAWKAFSQWQCRRSDTGARGLERKREMYAFLKAFRETFSRPVRRIRLLGLFDTVNSVPRFETAWMERSKFPYTARSSAKVVRHAVSIDERRAKFRQDLMYQSSARHAPSRDQRGAARQMLHDMHEVYRARHPRHRLPHGDDAAPPPAATPKLGAADEVEARGRRGSGLAPSSCDHDVPAPYRGHSRSKSCATGHGTRRGVLADHESNISHNAPTDDDGYDSEDETDQDIDEVWFAGGHGDVGGGWEVVPGVKPASHIPLTWMVREAMRAGLTFDPDKVVAMGCAAALDDDAADGTGPDAASAADWAGQPPPVLVVDGGPPAEDDGEKAAAPGGPAADGPRGAFHALLHGAHTARIHDSLRYGSGLGVAAVTSWRLMEYLPFRRMDLRPDGSWQPIRWPLPCGEVRDVPETARVHGSVLGRMRADPTYRPGNLIVGGGGRGCRVAPEERGMGQWTCVQGEGDPVGEVWVKLVNKETPEPASRNE